MGQKKSLTTVLLVFLLFFANLAYPLSEVLAFKFISWSDTQGTNGTLSSLSNQAKIVIGTVANPLLPAFTIYNGDLFEIEDGSPDYPKETVTNGLDAWKIAVNGGNNNGMFDITLPVRGNHDCKASNSDHTTAWQDFFNIRSAVGKLCTNGGGTSWQNQTITIDPSIGPELVGICTGGTVGPINFRELATDLTYSFDYEKSHFVGVDWGASRSYTTSQINWIDTDLAAAERRCLTHAFIFAHAAFYYVTSNHSDLPKPDTLITVLNKHKIVSALFHGHEHVKAWVHLNNSRIGATHEFEQFDTAPAGAGNHTCVPNDPHTCQVTTPPTCFCQQSTGFGLVEVNGDSFTVSFYSKDSNTPITGPGWPNPSRTFTKTAAACSSPAPTPTPTPIPTATPGGGKLGDVNGDGKIDLVDMGIIIDVYGIIPIVNTHADLNNDGQVNMVDIGIVIDNYGT